jgi:hypothetical protein
MYTRRERYGEKEKVSKKGEDNPGARPCLRFNPSRGDKPKTDQARPFLEL